MIFDLLLGEVSDDGIDEVLLDILPGEVVELGESAGFVALVMLDGHTVGLGLFLALFDGLFDQVLRHQAVRLPVLFGLLRLRVFVQDGRKLNSRQPSHVVLLAELLELLRDAG